MLLFPGYLKRLTVAYYLQALVPHAMPDDSAVSILLQVFHEVPPVAREPGLAGGDHRWWRSGPPGGRSSGANTCLNNRQARCV